VWLRVALLVTIVASLSATTVLRNRDYRSAEALWRTVVEAAPGNWRGQMNLGTALAKLDRNEESVVFLRAAVALDPDRLKAHVSLAAALFALQQIDEAEVHLLRALEINPKHKGAHEYIGEAYLETGDLKRAEHHLDRLDSICSFGCPEYSELKQAIAAYRATHSD